MPSSGAPQIITRVPLLEVLDAFNVAPRDAGIAEAVIVRGSLSSQNGTLIQKFFNGGGGAAVAIGLGNGVTGYKIPGPGAGAFASKTALQLGVPLFERRATAPILPALLYRHLRFTCRLTAWRGDVTNDGIFAVNLTDGGNPITGAFGYSGFGLEVTGSGNWRAVQRNVKLAALIQNVDTGFGCLTPRRLEIVYETGDAPLLLLKVDGVTVLTSAANPTMPSPSTASNNAAFMGVYSEGTTAGKNDWAALPSFTIEEL